jgi:hypothetical protein
VLGCQLDREDTKPKYFAMISGARLDAVPHGRHN